MGPKGTRTQQLIATQALTEIAKESIVTKRVPFGEGAGRWGWTDKLAADNDGLQAADEDLKLTLGDKVAIAAKAVVTGYVFRLNARDPFPGLVDEAIRQAKEEREETRKARR